MQWFIILKLIINKTLMILVLGSTGFLGRHVCENFKSRGLPYIGASLSTGTDLRSEKESIDLFQSIRPEIVVNCASFVGGIQFGIKHPVEIFQNNLKIALNIFNASSKTGVGKIINAMPN